MSKHMIILINIFLTRLNFLNLTLIVSSNCLHRNNLIFYTYRFITKLNYSNRYYLHSSTYKNFMIKYIYTTIEPDYPICTKTDQNIEHANDKHTS